MSPQASQADRQMPAPTGEGKEKKKKTREGRYALGELHTDEVTKLLSEPLMKIKMSL